MLARKKEIIVDLLLLLALVMPTFGALQLASQTPNTELQLEGVKYNLEVVTKPADLAKGLGGRNSLPEKNGMLFVFEKAGKHCIWMKNMRFSLDVIWLDTQRQVVKVASEVSANSYPQEFCPDKSAKYVIELNPGLAGGLKEGQRLSF